VKQFLLVLATAASLCAQSGATADDWPHYGGAYGAWRYSTLAQVNRGNVPKLAPAWVFQTGDYENGLQATPIVSGGVLYLSTSNSWVFALDGATGRLIWEYHFPLSKSIPLYGKQNRGAAVGHGRVFLGTADNHLGDPRAQPRVLTLPAQPNGRPHKPGHPHNEHCHRPKKTPRPVTRRLSTPYRELPGLEFMFEDEAIWHLCAEIFAYDPEPALARITAPVLGLLGAVDKVNPPEESVNALSAAVRPELLQVEVFPEADHRLHHGDPPRFVDGYLDRIASFVRAAAA